MSQSLKYRAEIDGLRALAVMLVFIFHLFPKSLSGGFIGVDVFFVISGFLISKIIFKDVIKNQFSFLDFYHRRVLRIFPALFALLIGNLLMSFFVLGSSEFLAVLKATRYGAAQISNILFAQGVGYFESGHSHSPLLHTWSLGVEEQFYLLWPLVLYLLHKLSGQKGLLWGLGFLTCFSFLVSQWMTTHQPQQGFYMVHSRLWELGLGGLLALSPTSKITNRAVGEFLSLGGLVLIAGSSFLLDGAMAFPGVNALGAVVGTVFFIQGSQVSRWVKAGFSSPAVVFIGKISYSLYLWHWPFISYFNQYYHRTPSLGEAFVIVVLAFAFAYLSWRWVETPFRHLRNPKQKAFHGWVLVGGLVVIGLFVVTANLLKPIHDANFRFIGEADVFEKSIHQAHDKCGYSTGDIRQNRALYKEADCSHSRQYQQQRLILFGDSHASHFFPGFEQWSRQNKASVGLLVSSSCPSLWGNFRLFQRNKEIKRCRQFSEYARSTILGDPSIHTVLLAMRVSQYTETTDNEESGVRTFMVNDQFEEFSIKHSRQVFQSLLQSTIEEILESGRRVILIDQIPMLRKDPKRCLESTRVLLSKILPASRQACFAFDKPWVFERLRFGRQLFDRLVSKYSVGRIDPTAYLPSAKHNGELIYFDDHHLNRQGAVWLGSQIKLNGP